MASKIRVYELARELGLTNKECLDLCESLGVPVKSHSSSVIEAQADRVRRKAAREGLIRETSPDEQEEAKPAEKKAVKKKVAKKIAKRAVEVAPKPEPAPAAEAAGEPEPEDDPGAAPAPDAPPRPARPSRAVKSSALKPSEEAALRAEEAAALEAAAGPPPSAPARPSRPPVKSAAPRPSRPEAPAQKAPVAPAEPASAQPAAVEPAQPARTESPAPAQPAPPAAPPRPVDTPAAEVEPATEADTAGEPAESKLPDDEAAEPTSASGEPIPPPAAPTSVSGKPIPPPPGAGGRGPAPGRSRPMPTGRGRSTRPSVPPPGGGGGPGGGAGRPGGGGRPGGPGGRRPPRRRGGRRRRNREELQPMDAPSYTPAEAPVPEGKIVVERASTPQDLGPKLNRTAADVVRFLMQQGEMVTATQSLNDVMIELFAAEVGADIRLVDPGEEQEVELQKKLEADGMLDEEPSETSVTRPPVITIMGHVDHGKTRLLDYIREANIQAGEAGGITQHIGAYQAVKDDKRLTFIDTPGHEAFTAMRARGADATDIVVLVVAADDGVMPQTLEALDHARAADVPIVVAVNKIDRENADPNRVMQQLSEHGLIPEEWGGDTIMVPVSAMTGDGVGDLLDNLAVVAELEDLQAEPEGRAAGVVLESHLDIGRGPVATILVQRGLLEVGDPLVAGAAWGRVRALINHLGEQVPSADPSTPVEVLGLSEVAEAGDTFVVAPDERTARQVAETREHWHRQASLGREAVQATAGARLEDIFEAIQAGEVATLALVVKADVHGTLEALTESLKKLERDDVKLSFVTRGVGGITESDIQLAATSNATIIGFNVRPDRKARELADVEDVEIRTYEIIYKVLEDIENAMVGMLEPEYEEVVTGDAEVREIFRVPRIGAIAGCMVLNGVVKRGSKVRFLRDGTVIWKGELSSLRRFKDDVQEVREGFECGIGLSDFQNLEPGDIIETFDEREIPRTL